MDNKKSKLSIFTNGFIKENPILVLVLGTCPTLAVSTQASNGIGMGLCVTFVLTFSNIFISALKKIIPDKVRIPCYIVVISKNSVVDSALDGLGMGLGYTCALTIMACIRELLGAGTLFGKVITANLFSPMSIFVLAPGGFFTFGCIIAALNKLTKGKRREKQKENKCLGCAGADGCPAAEEGGC